MSGLNQLSPGERTATFGIVGDKAERPDVGRKAAAKEFVFQRHLYASRSPYPEVPDCPQILPLAKSHECHALVECRNNNKPMASSGIFTNWHKKSSRFLAIPIPSDGSQRLNHARMIG